MINLIGRVLLRVSAVAAGRAAAKATTAVKNAADSAQTALRVPIVAAGAIGHAVSEASTTAVNAAADAFGRAALEVSTFASDAFGAVGDTVTRVTAMPSNSWSETSEIIVPQIASRSGSALRGLFFFAGAWFIALEALQLIWISTAYQANDATGVLEASVLTAVLFSAAFWLCREGRAWCRLAVAHDLQRDLSDECLTAADEARFRAAVRKLRRVCREPTLVEFIDRADLNSDTATLRQELDSVGLRELDETAIEVIRKSTRDIFVMSLVIVNPLIETAAFCVRALGMIRRIAQAFGHRPGRIGNLQLVRHILADIALLPVGMVLALETVRAGGSAVHRLARGVTSLGKTAMTIPEPHHVLAGAALTVGGGAVGAVGDVVESVTPRVADAALAAGRMGHLGLLAVAHVRPLPLSRSSYGRMRSVVYKQIVGLRRDAARQKKASGTEAVASRAGTAC
jgi:hypothetical protein